VFKSASLPQLDSFKNVFLATAEVVAAPVSIGQSSFGQTKAVS